jgi:hypothetical protein
VTTHISELLQPPLQADIYLHIEMDKKHNDSPSNLMYTTGSECREESGEEEEEEEEEEGRDDNDGGDVEDIAHRIKLPVLCRQSVYLRHQARRRL